LFIDEIDAITPKRETAQREMKRRIVTQFLTCMNGKLVLKVFMQALNTVCAYRVVMGTD